MIPTQPNELQTLLNEGQKLDLATKHYPSRGQSAVQELYETALGKLFLKRVSAKNHENCRVNPKNGTLAEREFWAFQFASMVGLDVPELRLLDANSTVQRWLNYPDAHQFSSTQEMLRFEAENVFDCALFDWVTGQQDRHDANYLYDFGRRKIILIDSAHSFLRHDGSLPDYLKMFEATGTKHLHRYMHTTLSTEIKAIPLKALGLAVPLRAPEEIEALVDRLERVRNVNTLAGMLSLYRTR